MRLPDLDLARRCLALHPPPGRLLLCSITGSHHHGFPSADSDLDIKGIHLAPTEKFLGFEPPAASFDFRGEVEGVECDVTTSEARQALSLLLDGNGNVLERILSPYQLVDTAEGADLRALALASLSRASHRHYAGFFRQMCREHERQATTKTMLYSYRVALTGAHLLRCGEVVADLSLLGPQYGFGEALELIARKREGREHDLLPTEDSARHRANWPRLEARLDEALAASVLPNVAPTRQRCEDWLIALRRRELGLRASA